MSDIKIYDDDPIQSVDGINRLTLERAKNSALSARLAEADKANQLLRADIAAQSREEDLILTALRLDPERYRTECGYLNVPKIIAAIKHPNEYPRLTDSAPAADCPECGGSGVVNYRAFDGTEEGHIEEAACACMAATASQPTVSSK